MLLSIDSQYWFSVYIDSQHWFSALILSNWFWQKFKTILWFLMVMIQCIWFININIFIIYYILLIIYINFIENDNEHWPLHPADSIGNDGIWFGNLFGVPVYVTTKAEFHLFLVACSNFYFATSSSTCYEYRWITDAQVALYLFIRIKWNLFQRIMSSWKPKIRVKTWQN